MQSLSLLRQNRASERKAVLAGWPFSYMNVLFSKTEKCLYLPYINLYTHNLLHYYKAGDQASSVELLDDLRFILSICKE